jgi:hypothetical protein
MQIHLQRKNKITSIPDYITFTVDEIASFINHYSNYHLSLFSGLDFFKIQSIEKSEALSYQYEEVYNNPYSIIDQLSKVSFGFPINCTQSCINIFNDKLSFQNMKRIDYSSSLRGINYPGDIGYYIHGRPDVWKEKIPSSCFKIFIRELEGSASARLLYEKYSFPEASHSFY